jgi:tape measure domain-containing protein
MEFDNASFEKKLGTTLTSLDKLEKSLKFEGASKGLQNVSQAAGKMNLSHVGNAVTGIKDKFSAMSVVGVAALATIASKAVSAGGRIVKSLALDQIIGGFKEYETNIGSIQTILANTKDQCTNLKDVNGALDQLNTYSDKTIYNFGQMAKNIGTFTAAGVDLDTSVQSIKGIANLAAISGSSSDQASTAMYQLSQAISSGTLKLQDWNSVTNAGMGGKVFQKALFESGKALGKIKDVPMDQTFEQWTDAGNSFRGSLQDGWLTSDVLTTTLQGFTGEMTKSQLVAKGFSEEAAANMIELGKTGVDAATQVRTLTGLIDTTKEAIGSGWSASFRIIFGDFEEATKLFTGISKAVGDMVGKSADARNELLKGWKNLGGRTLLIESLKTTIKNLGKILKPIKDAFREIFPPMTAKRLFQMTKSFNEFEAFRPSKDTVNDL